MLRFLHMRTWQGIFEYPWKDVTIDLLGNYSVKENVVSWRHTFKLPSLSPEAGELHLETLKFYRKILNNGPIYNGKCKLIKSNR